MADIDSSTRTAVIRIGTTEAVKNVKDLRDNIKDLRDEIVALSNSEQKDADTQKALADAEAKLIQSQQELNRVMGLTKKGADGVEGSYANLKAQLRETKAAMDAIPKIVNNQLNPAWDALAQRYRKLNDEAKEYDFSLGNFQRNVGNYGNAWESLGKSMGEVKQVGGDMQNGIASLSGLLGIAGLATDGLDEGMNNFRLTLGLVQGAKGIAGMLKSLVKFVAGQKAATTATKESTAAQKANAASLEATTVAETSAAAAGTVLRTVLMSLGIGIIVAAIGALVANLETVVGWFTKLGEKLGFVSKETEIYVDANEKLNTKFDEQKTLLDDQQKILKAQGVSTKELLKAKLDLIKTQIAETEATIENIKARQEQMKNDSAWVRFWTGENRKIKKAQEEIDALTESLKTLKREQTEINIDIQVEEITEANNARKKAADEAKKAEEKYQKALADSQKKIRELQKTELSNIEVIREERAETMHLVNDVYLTEIEKLKALKQTPEVIEEINRLEAKVKQNAEIVADYYLKTQISAERHREYEDLVAKAIGKQNYEQEKLNRYENERGRLLKDILGYSNGQIKNASRANEETKIALNHAEKMKAVYDNIGNIVAEMTSYDFPPDFDESEKSLDKFIKHLTGGLHTIESAYEMSILDPKTFEEQFEEPIRTAIVGWGKAQEQYKAALAASAKDIVDTAFESFNEALGKGDYAGAKTFLDKLLGGIGDNEALSSIRGELTDEIQKLYEEIYREILSDSNPLAAIMSGKGVWNNLFNQMFNAPVEAAKNALNALKQELSTYEAGSGKYLEIQEKIDQAEVALHKARMNRLQAWNTQALKYLSTYGAATANMLDAVAGAWEESLKAQDKTNEDAFKGVKALQYSTAVINTAAAVVQAMSDPTVPSWFVKAANAAAALAAGTAQVIKISQTKYGSESGNNSAPRLIDRTPQVQYTYGLNAADYAEAAAQNPVRAYVVDKDLRNGLDNYDARRNETTF